LRSGSRIAVEGPVGTFVFPADPVERQFLFVAGGTGIAPLRSMIGHALQAGVKGRLHLLYSARTPADFAYLPEMRRYAADGQLELAVYATREVPKRWRERRGRITRDQLTPLVEDPETLCFVCGPAAMVADVPRMLVEIGIDPKRIRVEEW
jgi:xylene monooxygenase electron transfer component